MHKAIEYFNEMIKLDGQGVFLDWKKTARHMALIVAESLDAQAKLPVEPSPPPPED